MGYACPVCDVPQRDGEHLAHHLAFMAMIHSDEHETWLDERAPEWNDSTPAELAEAVTPHAAQTEYEDVFEDTVHDHSHGRGRGDPTHTNVDVAGSDGGDVDAETRAVLEEARDMTRQMLDGDETEDGDDAN